MTVKKKWEELTVVSAVVVAIGFMMAGYFIGKGFYKSRMANRFVTVKGLSEKSVKADRATWQISFSATGDYLATVQQEIDEDRGRVLVFLKQQGLGENEFKPGRLDVTDVLASAYRPKATQGGRFIIKDSVIVDTDKVDLISSASEKLSELVNKEVVLVNNYGPSYIFTKLNEIKPAMIAEATGNARRAAEQCAKDSGSDVGGIRRAYQGIFRIMPLYGEGQESKQIDKKVRVVSTVDYFLED